MIPLVLQSVVGTHHLIFDGGVAQFFFARFFFRAATCARCFFGSCWTCTIFFFCVKLQSRFCAKIKNCADFEFYSVYTFAKHNTCSMQYYKSEYTISAHLTMLPLITTLRSLKTKPLKL